MPAHAGSGVTSPVKMLIVCTMDRLDLFVYLKDKTERRSDTIAVSIRSFPTPEIHPRMQYPGFNSRLLAPYLISSYRHLNHPLIRQTLNNSSPS